MDNALFSEILSEFIKSPSIELLEIGKVLEWKLLFSFKRPFSYQGVYKLIGENGYKKVYVKINRNLYHKSPDEFQELLKRDFETQKFWYDQFLKYPDFTTFKPL